MSARRFVSAIMISIGLVAVGPMLSGAAGASVPDDCVVLLPEVPERVGGAPTTDPCEDPCPDDLVSFRAAQIDPCEEDVAPPTTDLGSGGGQLPSTGTSTGHLLVGAGLLAAGGLAIVATRRRAQLGR